MIEFSPGLLLIPYFIYLAVHFFLMLLNIKHLFRVGALTFLSFVFTSIFIVYTILILGATWSFVGSFDWQTPIELNLGSITSVQSL